MGKYERSSNWRGRSLVNDKRLDNLEEKVDILEQRGQDAKLHGVLTEGDLVSINSDITKYDVVSIDYYINGTKYNYSGSLANSTGFTNSGEFLVIGLDSSGLITKLNGFFSPTELENIIEISAFSTTDGINIGPIGDSVFLLSDRFKNFYKRMKLYEGAKFLADALLADVQIDRTINTLGGFINTPNLEEKNISTKTSIDVFEVYSVSGSYDQFFITDYVVNNTHYDNGTDLILLSNNKFATHTLLFSTRTEVFYFVISSGEYANEVEALDAPVDFGPFSDAGSEIVPISKIVVQQGQPEVITFTDERNNLGNIVSASTRTFQNTYDRSTIPQIILSAGKNLQFRNDTTDSNYDIIEYTSNDGLKEYFKITKDGYVSTPVWKDNLRKFSRARGNGTTEPAWVNIGNGIYQAEFTVGEEMFANFHINHDYRLLTDAYLHVHFMVDQTMTRGQQVTWEFAYNVTRGHQQGESFLDPLTTFTLTYTATGTEVAGEHIILERTIREAFQLKEPDTIVQCRVRLDSENVRGRIFGYMSDIHYLADREGTPQKSPDFYISNN